MNFNLSPLKSVGPFKFGSNIKKYSNFSLIEINEEFDSEVNWKVYKVKNRDIRIYVEEGLIISIACYDQCIYKNKNLIGLDINELKQIFQLEPTECNQQQLESEVLQIYDFDSLALEVFVKNNIVVSITCSDEYQDS